LIDDHQIWQGALCIMLTNYCTGVGECTMSNNSESSKMWKKMFIKTDKGCLQCNGHKFCNLHWQSPCHQCIFYITVNLLLCNEHGVSASHVASVFGSNQRDHLFHLLTLDTFKVGYTYNLSNMTTHVRLKCKNIKHSWLKTHWASM